MKILQINKFHYVEGGTEKYYLELSKLLERHNNEVAYFSMDDNKNLPSTLSKYFVSNISFREVDLKSGFKFLKRMIYSNEAVRKINKLLDQFHPDIAHIHNIYNHISPSILPEIKKRGIPIVQTVHDYHQLAPNRNLFHDGKICEVTKPDKYYKALLHRCVKGSYLATFANIITLYIHRMFGLYNNNVDYFIAPSMFVKNLLIEYGFNPKKIIYLPNFVDIDDSVTTGNSSNVQKYILYFGRFSVEKGLIFLLKVAKNLPNINFKLVGRGPQEEILRNITKKKRLRNVEFLDHRESKRLNPIISDSYFTILTSIWYENLPNSILESFILGKPVIASNIGGIPEVIENDSTGFLFETGNTEDCISKIKKLWNNPYLVKKMGENARSYVKKRFNPERHHKQLMNIYKKAIGENMRN